MKRGLVAAAVAAVSSLIPFASPASAETGGSGCVFDAGFTFSGGPVLSPEKNFTYTFSGSLSNCQGIAAPGTAVVFAGLYDYPVPNANGGCANASTHGRMIVYWADRTVTLLKYDTAGPFPATVLNATTTPSLGNYKTTRFIGGSAAGAFALVPGNPLDCGGTGVGIANAKGSMTFASA